MRRFAREEGGQSLVELALTVPPILALLVFGMIEFGTVYNHALTIAAASREGARVAGALVNGGGTLGCGGGESPNWTTVDPNVIAAVERVIKGTKVTLADVTEIRIYKSTSTGGETAGEVNRWTYSAGAGPNVGGVNLDFIEAQQQWRACERTNISPGPDSAGVTISYTYRAQTPLGWLVPGLASIPIRDTTVMSMNANR